MGFSHSNFPSCLRLRLVTFFEILVTKIWFHLGCYTSKRDKLLMLFAKNRNSLDSTSSREQTVFLISSRGTEPRCCSSRLRPNKHFQDHQMAWGLRQGRGCTTMPIKASPWGWAEAGFGSSVSLDQYVHHLLVTWVQSTKLPSRCFCFSVCIHVDCAFGICSAGWAGRGLLLLLIDKPECLWTGSELKCLL